MVCRSWKGARREIKSTAANLNERYRRHRSRLWYWREVLIAIISTAFMDIRNNKALGLRAILFGLVVLHALGNGMFALYGRLLFLSLRGGLGYGRPFPFGYASLHYLQPFPF